MMAQRPPVAEGILERLFEPGELEYLARILQSLDAMATELRAVTRQLQVVAASLAGIPAAREAGVPERPPIPLPALQLPLSPPILNQMINAANLPGVATMGVLKLSTTVPAGSTVTVSVPVLPGTVAVFMTPLQVTATFYSAAITANVFVDGKEVTSRTFQYAITGEDRVEFGQYYYMFKGLIGEITNNTATSTTITFKVEVLAIDRRFFDGFYQPLIGHSYRAMAELAQLLTGGQPLP